MSEQLKERTKAFGIRVINMARKVRNGRVEDVLIRQIVRSATAVGANYRSAFRGRSKAEFISKISIAKEEADESCYWLEVFTAIKLFPPGRLEPLLKEAREITAILTTSRKNAQQSRK